MSEFLFHCALRTGAEIWARSDINNAVRDPPWASIQACVGVYSCIDVVIAMSRPRDLQVVVLVTLFGDGPFKISPEAMESPGQKGGNRSLPTTTDLNRKPSNPLNIAALGLLADVALNSSEGSVEQLLQVDTGRA